MSMTDTPHLLTRATGTLTRLRPLLLLLGAMALAWAFGLRDLLSFERLAANKGDIERFVAEHLLLAAIGYFGLYAVVVALSLPVASFLTIFGGFVFGPVIGGTLTVGAATLGALAVFLIARSSLGETMQERAGPWLERLRSGFQDHALNYLLFLRLVPLFPFWLVNIAPALLGVGTATYLIGTLVGIIPATYAFAYVGAGLGSIIDAQARAQQLCLDKAHELGQAPACQMSLRAGDLVTGEVLIALAALGVVALIPVVLKKLTKS
jgi:uncharacterized membrane protein YdjX (TVP38/TMEM64 family)